MDASTGLVALARRCGLGIPNWQQKSPQFFARLPGRTHLVLTFSENPGAGHPRPRGNATCMEGFSGPVAETLGLLASSCQSCQATFCFLFQTRSSVRIKVLPGVTACAWPHDPTRRSHGAIQIEIWIVPVILTCLSYLPTAQNASAISAEVAKKCRALIDTAYPFRVPGNPAAGRTLGTVQDVQNYFSKCLANGGNVPGQAPTKENHQDTQAPKTR
jgi:hypothetical protein